LRDNVLTSISTALGDGTSATSVGLSVTKDGQLAFDSSAFQTAFAANPSTVQSAFGPSISYAPAKPGLTGSITLQNSTDGTLAGSYDVTVTQAATRAAATIDTSGGLVAGQTITLGSGTNSQTYTVTNTDTVQSVTDALNAMSATNNLGVNANLDTNGTTIDLSAAGYGAQYTFTSSATGGLTASAVTAGLDVAGTINGQAAQGIGQLLFTTSNTTGIGAITLDVTLTPSDVTTLAGSAGTFTYQMGAAQKLASVAYAAVATTKGSLTNEITGENSTIADLNTQIANWQVVLDTKQASLEQLWSGLETQLGNLQAQGTALGAAITAMSGGTTSTSSAPKTA